MKVAGSYTFEASQEEVWEALQDPTVLTGVLPGCERLEEVGDQQYEGELNIKVGPVQGKFKGRVEMRNLEPPNSFTLAVDGRGSSGFVKATAKVGLEAQGDRTEFAAKVAKEVAKDLVPRPVLIGGLILILLIILFFLLT